MVGDGDYATTISPYLFILNGFRNALRDWRADRYTFAALFLPVILVFAARMDSYDLIMILVLAGTTLWGAWKGLAWQLASLTAIIASYFMALRFSEALAPMFGSEAPLNRFVAMFAIYMGTSLVVWVLFHFVKSFINRLRLQEFDHQIGAVVGAGKGVLFCVVITFFAVTLIPSGRDTVLQSSSGHYIALLLNRADPVIPSEIHKVLDPYLNRLETELQPDGAKPQDAPGVAPPRSGS